MSVHFPAGPTPHAASLCPLSHAHVLICFSSCYLQAANGDLSLRSLDPTGPEVFLFCLINIHHLLPVLTAPTTSSLPWASLLTTVLTSSDLLSLCLQTPAWHHSVSPTRQRKPCAAHTSCPCLCFQPRHLTLISGELCCQH